MINYNTLGAIIVWTTQIVLMRDRPIYIFAMLIWAAGPYVVIKACPMAIVCTTIAQFGLYNKQKDIVKRTQRTVFDDHISLYTSIHIHFFAQ